MVTQAPAKAALIKKILVDIFNGHHQVSLYFLQEVNDAVAARYLGHFEGLGKKTVGNCIQVLKQGGSGPNLEVARVLRRLNLIKSSLDQEEIEELLCEALPLRRRDHFCRLVKTHAQRVCTLKGFACKSCKLLLECPTGKYRTNRPRG
jgi:endonuclease III